MQLWRRWMLKTLLWLVLVAASFAQTDTVVAHFIPGDLKIDGRLDEPVWQKARAVNHFWQVYPQDSIPAKYQTTVRVLYNTRYLYIGAFCYDPQPGDYVVESMQRDFSYPKNDAFAVYLDPSRTRTEGYNFTISPYGVQREGTISSGGDWGVSTNWDQEWYGAVFHTDSGWSVEMAIPFSALQFPAGSQEWYVNFSRNNLKYNENSAWQPVPRNRNVAGLAYTGILRFEHPLLGKGLQIFLQPYHSSQVQYEPQRSGALRYKTGLGFDAKMPLLSSLQADFTVLPDFSQVEIDEQVINLERFSIFLPEKRPFFLENQDLFAYFGFFRIRPFFSRRIGIWRGQQVPILGGVKITGRPLPRLRLGILAMRTDRLPEAQLSPQTYAVATMQYRLFQRSDIGFLAVTRFGRDFDGIIGNDWNVTLGSDFFLATNNNRWRGKLFYHLNFSPVRPASFATGGWLMYKTPSVVVHWNHEYVDSNYTPEVGFVPRRGHWRLEPSAAYRYYFFGKVVNDAGIRLGLDWYVNPDWQQTQDRIIELKGFLNFRNTSSLDVNYQYRLTVLPDSFDVTGTGIRPLPPGEYRIAGVTVEYNSDYRQPFAVEAEGRWQRYYLGRLYGGAVGIRYQFRPYGTISLDASYSCIQLPAPYGSADVALVRLRNKLSFSPTLTLSGLVQYSTQSKRLEANVRLQWRFLPMSDLYFVYTLRQSMEPGATQPPAMGVALKMSYWIGIAG